MAAAFPQCPEKTDWKALYRAAIVETNKRAAAEKVSEAETAVLARVRELFYEAGNADEQDALKEALYALRAFRTALQHAEAA